MQEQYCMDELLIVGLFIDKISFTRDKTGHALYAHYWTTSFWIIPKAY